MVFSSVTPILAKCQLVFFKESWFSELPFFVSKILHNQISCFSNYSFMFEMALDYWEKNLMGYLFSSVFIKPAFPFSYATKIKVIISRHHVTENKYLGFCSARQTVARGFRKEQWHAQILKENVMLPPGQEMRKSARITQAVTNGKQAIGLR